jgi:hypothetical protein
MIARGGLLEILQGGQGARIVLDLVEDDQGAFWLDRASDFDAQTKQEAFNVEVFLEQLRHAFVRLEINVGDAFIVSAAELFKQPRFADLPGSVHDEGLAMWIRLPGNQVRECCSFHAGEADFSFT